jgi:hypothetical protein
MTFGPYDTLFSVAGLLFIADGPGSIPCYGRRPAASRPSPRGAIGPQNAS